MAVEQRQRQHFQREDRHALLLAYQIPDGNFSSPVRKEHKRIVVQTGDLLAEVEALEPHAEVLHRHRLQAFQFGNFSPPFNINI